METNIIVMRRIVPNISSENLEKSKIFYIDFLGMELVMDMGWILTFASKDNSTAQISILQNDKKEKPDNQSIFLSIEISDVAKMYEKAKQMNCNITYEITDEPWDVRRFFVLDPNGATINLMTHIN